MNSVLLDDVDIPLCSQLLGAIEAIKALEVA